MTRRLAGMVKVRLAEAEFDQVPDGRDARGQRWVLATLLRATVTAIMAGAKSLADAERVTATLPQAARRWLGIARRVPDTTLRNALSRLQPDDVSRCLRSVIVAAYRRKALAPSAGLPFGTVALDGKVFVIPGCDDFYAQRQCQGEGMPVQGLVRTITATLTSSPARPCIDVTPITAHSNGILSQRSEPSRRSLRAS
jgi:hypothetical protein